MREKIWKTIPDFSFYEASNDGEIRIKKTNKILPYKIAYGKLDGYISVYIKNDDGENIFALPQC